MTATNPIIINIPAGGLIMTDAIFNRKDNLHTYIISGGKEKKVYRCAMVGWL